MTSVASSTDLATQWGVFTTYWASAALTADLRRRQLAVLVGILVALVFAEIGATMRPPSVKSVIPPVAADARILRISYRRPSGGRYARAWEQALNETDLITG